MNSQTQSQNKKQSIIKNATAQLLEMFQTGNFPKGAAMSIIWKHKGDDIPSYNWSLGNRLLMKFQGTDNARGFKQWQSVNRRVKKGSKAIYIFRPLIRHYSEPDEKTGVDIQKNGITGFSTLPVFRLEDTDGDELPHFDHSPEFYPLFFDAAQKLRIKLI